MDLSTVRRIAITAMFADDFLMDRVVLKGGNALSIVHGIGARASLDLDFSIENDFPDPDEARDKIFRSLKMRFDSAGYVVFDETFVRRPAVPRPGQSSRWGGYQVEFKLIERAKYTSMNGDFDAIRRQSLVVGPAQMRTFTIDLSRYEYCDPKQETKLDDFIIFVYSPEMIAVEKTRAICQQMPEYAMNLNPHARARDFYDISVIVETCGLDFASLDIHELARNIFAAKDVPLSLIANIPNHKEFHRTDWPKVEQAVGTAIGTFDEYFSFVLREAAKLEPLWVM